MRKKTVNSTNCSSYFSDKDVILIDSGQISHRYFSKVRVISKLILSLKAALKHFLNSKICIYDHLLKKLIRI